MQPFDVGGVRQMRRRIGVVPVIGDGDGLAPEVGREIAGPAVGELRAVVEDIGSGVRVGVIEAAIGLQELGDDLGPAPYVGQPAGDAPARIDQVERCRPGDGGGRVVEIRFDEARAVGKAELRREIARRSDRRPGEIEPHHRGAALGETERVGAEVALQVQHAQPLHRAELGLVDGIECAATRAQRREIVARRLEMNGDPLVPVGAVEFAPVLRGVAHETVSSAPVNRR